MKMKPLYFTAASWFGSYPAENELEQYQRTPDAYQLKNLPAHVAKVKANKFLTRLIALRQVTPLIHLDVSVFHAFASGVFKFIWGPSTPNENLFEESLRLNALPADSWKIIIRDLKCAEARLDQVAPLFTALERESNSESFHDRTGRRETAGISSIPTSGYIYIHDTRKRLLEVLRKIEGLGLSKPQRSRRGRPLDFRTRVAIVMWAGGLKRTTGNPHFRLIADVLDAAQDSFGTGKRKFSEDGVRKCFNLFKDRRSYLRT